MKTLYILLSIILLSEVGMAQAELDVMRIRHDIMPIPNNHWLKYSDASNSLIHYLNDEALKLLDARSEKYHNLLLRPNGKKDNCKFVRRYGKH